LISVLIDEPKGVVYGGLIAGPVFREVGSWALNHLRVNPQPDLLAAADVKTEKTSLNTSQDAGNPPELPEVRALADHLWEGLLPDFKGMGMREVLKKGRALGLRVCLEGSGVAVTQKPEAGSPIETVETVTVSFNPPGPS
jgi:cell division protein FtsI (penicillin-binding protein 3)